MKKQDKIMVDCEYCDGRFPIEQMQTRESLGIDAPGFVCQDISGCDERDSARSEEV